MTYDAQFEGFKKTHKIREKKVLEYDYGKIDN
jgi:hypothetical protein